MGKRKVEKCSKTVFSDKIRFTKEENSLSNRINHNEIDIHIKLPHPHYIQVHLENYRYSNSNHPNWFDYSRLP